MKKKNKMATNFIQVWFDFSCDIANVSALLYEHAGQYNYKFNQVSQEILIASEENDCLSAESLASRLCVKSESSYLIVITDKALNSDVAFIEKKNCMLISVFTHEKNQYQEKELTKIIYAASVFSEYTGLIKQVNLESFILKDALSITADISLLGVVLPENFNEILGRITYNSPPPLRHALITHGIRTHAEWTEDAYNVLKEKKVSSSILIYGWVDIFKFTLNMKVRDRYAIELLSRINGEVQLYPRRKFSIIVHSFGSIVLAKALEFAEITNNRIAIDSIILSGSILPQKFDWIKYTKKGKNFGITINQVLNVCGDKDIWPVIAEYAVKGAGYSGTFFFSDNHSNNILNIRLENKNHESILSTDTVNDVWLKFLFDARMLTDRPSIRPSKRVSLIHYLFILIKYGVVALIILFVSWHIFNFF